MEATGGEEPTTSPATVQSSSFLGLDRFTLAMGIGVLALIAVAILAVLIRPSEQQTLDESRPAGVVQAYYLALANDEPRRAYDYLSTEARSKTSYEQFAARYRPPRNSPTVRIDDERIEGDTARVKLRWTHSSRGEFLFGSRDSSSERTLVLSRENNAWRLTQSDQLW